MLKMSEDCLFLNVFAPSNATELPVFVWIHGGGYNAGSASAFDPSALMKAGNNGFVSVIVQYRLGPYGFLSSEEVKDAGGLNAGIQDIQLTLQWVQMYIGMFGGDPGRVTIAGESAGAGAVMILATAYGGGLGPTLFENSITASPFLPQTFHFNEQVILEQYWTFAKSAGCSRLDSLRCLQAASTESLAFATAAVASKSLSGTFSFKPVVDGDLVPQRLSKTLDGPLNGKRVLTGNNANEGFAFTPQNITTLDAFTAYLRTYFPRLTADNITAITSVYTTPADVLDSDVAPKFATSGVFSPTALNQSQVSTGHQQVANNFYAEVTFACPSYWLAGAYMRASDRAAFQYQFSVTPALHGFDTLFYFPARERPVDAGVSRAFMDAYAGFVAEGVPDDWPQKTAAEPLMRNLNATGGRRIGAGPFTMFEGADVAQGDVDADVWEGGRRMRCDFLRSLADELVI
ncbi:Carboxylesterase type B [Macrophomina phaseolina MS6]|uniref:Carboxylic ester hydrolase n=1 Tax=Macrophomina phaseolina (strain MS6) TaxID=1126212 RepID=K2RJ78_MACPH|nr:Carboxylesterase type B [Macrophomina phaseolina MS6]